MHNHTVARFISPGCAGQCHCHTGKSPGRGKLNLITETTAGLSARQRIEQLANWIVNMVWKRCATLRTRTWLSRSALGLACVVSGHAVAGAQQPAAPPAQQPQTEQDLTEGLLDLLTEPAPQPATPSPKRTESADNTKTPTQPDASPDAQPGAEPSTEPAKSSTPSPLGGSRGLGAKDFGAGDLGDGEDLGASGTNPLAEVRMEMLTAAGWLRDQSAVDKTEQLQRDIVARLDQLIDDLSQQPTPQSPPPSEEPQSPSDTQPPQQDRGQEASAKQAEGNERTREQQTVRDMTTADEARADARGTEGQPAPGTVERKGVVVDLNDPTALQRSAWGNLPDRVREQMQSRMVERFLPGYREQIEAYYRALSR